MRLARDSLAASKTNGDSLAASLKRLDGLRLLVAGKDSAVRSATEEINSSRRDSLSAQTQDRKDMQKRERDIAALDSIVVAVQDDKNKFFRMKEKFQLDSAIETLSGQLGEFLNKPYEVRSAATGPDAEKAQTLDVYKGKLDNLMRDEAFAALVAKIPGKTWREQNRQITRLLDAAQKTLDSASLTRERIVRDGVLAQKQFAQVSGNFAADNKRLNDLIAKTWKELINAKPRIVRMERDSAEAVKRCETSSACVSKGSCRASGRFVARCSGCGQHGPAAGRAQGFYCGTRKRPPEGTRQCFPCDYPGRGTGTPEHGGHGRRARQATGRP